MRPQSKPKRAAAALGARTAASAHSPARTRRAGAGGRTRGRRRSSKPRCQVFAEKGFAAARMDDIAARARVSKGTIYLYFESKEAVFRALVQATLVRRVSDLARIRSRP